MFLLIICQTSEFKQGCRIVWREFKEHALTTACVHHFNSFCTSPRLLAQLSHERVDITASLLQFRCHFRKPEGKIRIAHPDHRFVCPTFAFPIEKNLFPFSHSQQCCNLRISILDFQQQGFLLVSLLFWHVICWQCLFSPGEDLLCTRTIRD